MLAPGCEVQAEQPGTKQAHRDSSKPLLDRPPPTMVTCYHKEGDHMSRSKGPKSSREKVRAYRERLRKQGLRPIQIWVPDVRSPSFANEAHRQAAAVGTSTHAADDQEFIDAVSELDTE